MQVSTNKRDKESNAFLKLKLVVDYNGFNRSIWSQTSRLPNTKEAREKILEKNIFPFVRFFWFNSFILRIKSEFVSEYHTELRISTTGGRWKTPGPMRLIECRFPEFIPPTQKKDSPTRCCVVYCKKRDERGKRRRKETRYYCKPCDKGLCAV